VSFIARPSIQEFSVPGPLDRPSQRYFDWVDDEVPAVQVVRDGDRVAMHLLSMERPAIELRAAPSVDGREKFDVCGGILVREPAGGRFVFEEPSPGRLRISLEGFTPRLPRIVYILTHALVHEYVMWSFRRHMEVPQLEAS